MQAPWYAHSNLQDAGPTEHGYDHLSQKHEGILKLTLASQLPHSTCHTYKERKSSCIIQIFYQHACEDKTSTAILSAKLMKEE